MKPSRRSAPRTWVEEELPLGLAFRAQASRLLRRGRASWFVWVPLALLLGTLLALRAARHIVYTATVVVWATSSRPADDASAEVGLGKLRSYVRDWALTGEHLLEVMGRYPRQFPDAVKRPSEAIASMREAIELSIETSNVVEDRAADDPLPAARITVSFAAATPDRALTMARELARLVVSSALQRQGALAARAAAASAAALKQSETSFDTTLADAPGSADAALASLRAAVAAATNATLADRAGEENGTWRFDVVDWGQPPPLRSRRMFIEELVVLFAIGLLVSWLLAGAFDPRVIDRADLTEAGLTVLGEVPRLPRPSLPRSPAQEWTPG